MTHPVIERFSKLSGDFALRVDGVTDWSAASPCEGWTARDLVAHVTNNYRRLAGNTDEVGADEDVAAAFHSARTGLIEALGQPGYMETMAPGPMGPMPIEQLVGRLICNDTLVHTWDLARATGQDETLDAEMAAGMLAGMEPMADMLVASGHFGPRVEVADDAPVQTRLLALVGRRA